MVEPSFHSITIELFGYLEMFDVQYLANLSVVQDVVEIYSVKDSY